MAGVKKKGWLIVLLLLVSAGTIVWIIWNKPHRDVKNETGIIISAQELVKEYSQDETLANKKYLDKAMLVNGTVTGVGKDQDGATTVNLQSDSSGGIVYCTLRKGERAPDTGKTVAVKGICTGKLSDVIIIDAVINE